MHKVTMNECALDPELGLLFGNGNLSVSIYRTANQLIWRFGKNDVWDRRLDLSDDAKPVHIEEIAHGIRDEGWVSKGYGAAQAKATRGTKNAERMKEICSGAPSYANRPYPCPKPVGELALHLPIDQRGMKIEQTLHIEKALVEIECSWQSGARFHIECFVPPRPNALVVNWKVTGWTENTAEDRGRPVWFTLYRWPDPSVTELATDLTMRVGYRYFRGSVASPKVTPLPPPALVEMLGRNAVEQRFYPDLQFPEGFRYAMVPFDTDCLPYPVNNCSTGVAALRMWTKKRNMEGSIAVLVPTSTDNGGVEGELTRTLGEIGKSLRRAVRKWAASNADSARAFWGKSSVRLAEPILEDTWYEALHIRRSGYRKDNIAPGLALPSTVKDYSLWHGDYHTNYNYQQCFWADYTANHVDLGDSFFPGMEYMVELGRKLAKKYWNCRGTFIQLTGYPFPIEDDPYSSGPLCRMAYMTGWISNHYWNRYLYLLDTDWLREYGYPVMRDCALFYTDFLKKGKDGKYHVFPSLQGERFFTGKIMDFTDQPQVIRHARYCLQTVADASEVLGLDVNLRSQWREMATNIAQVDDLDALGYSAERKRRYYRNPPEFIAMDTGRDNIPVRKRIPRSLTNAASGAVWRCIGMSGFAWPMMTYLHNEAFDPARDFKAFRDTVARMRLENGTIPAMDQESHFYIGLYGEAQGILAPIQEMLLQSWDGVIRIFPAWPKNRDASFKTFRAEGAFIVTAEQKRGRVRSLSITSEKGGVCRVKNPWNTQVAVITKGNRKIETRREKFGVIAFDAVPGGDYRLAAGTSPR